MLLLLDTYLVTVETGADSISVSWRSDNPILEQELRYVQVFVTSVGTMPPNVVQSFTVVDGVSVNVRGLGNYYITVLISLCFLGYLC